MPSPHRIAVVRVPDDALTAALTARAPRGSHRVFRDLADDLQALLAFAPELLFFGGGDDPEDIGALRALRAALPNCTVVLVARRADELQIAPTADRLGALVLTTPFAQAELSALLEASDSSPGRPPLQAFGDLLRGVADEVNNPLMAALGHLQLTECFLDPERDAAALEQLRAAREALDRIAHSLSRITTLGRARSLRHPLPAVDLRKSLRQVLRGLPDASTARIRIRRLQKLAVRGDRELLHTALAALCATALDLAAPDREIRLDLRRIDAVVQLRLRLPPDAAESWHLAGSFLPYHIARVLRGTPHGLDLFLVQSIAHAHGGRAVATRRSAGDLELHLELPSAPE
ncbi:MAG: hypothetical protein U1F36_07730 [Planctomycetota bacterium]